MERRACSPIMRCMDAHVRMPHGATCTVAHHKTHCGHTQGLIQEGTYMHTPAGSSVRGPLAMEVKEGSVPPLAPLGLPADSMLMASEMAPATPPLWWRVGLAIACCSDIAVLLLPGLRSLSPSVCVSLDLRGS